MFLNRRPTPVVILPGYTSSLPKSSNMLEQYLVTLGFPADDLAVVPEGFRSSASSALHEPAADAQERRVRTERRPVHRAI